MVRILLSSGWAHRGQTEFECHEGDLLEVITEFVAAYPGYRHRLLDAEGRPRSYYNVYLNDDLVHRDRRAGVRVESGSTVAIGPPLAGG
jgi:molybdopterin synthase sulfur carrier subunit